MKMRVLDNLEIVYHRKGLDLRALLKSLEDIEKKFGVPVSFLNSKIAGKISLKVSVLEDDEPFPVFALRVLYSGDDPTSVPLGEWANLPLGFVEEADFLEEHAYMKVQRQGDQYHVYVRFSDVKDKTRNDVVKDFMTYLLGNLEEYDYFVKDVEMELFPG